MRKFTTIACGAALLAAPFLVSCDDDDDDIDNPGVSIVSPLTGSVEELEADDMTIDITVDPDDFDLEEAEDCAGEPNCGIVVLKIDGDKCNRPGTSYNTASNEEDSGGRTTLEADFSLCPSEARLGPHQVTVSLQRHDGTPVMRVDGAPAEATMQLTTALDDD